MHARLTVNWWIVSPAAAGPSQAWRLADRTGVRRRLLTGHKLPAHHGRSNNSQPDGQPTTRVQRRHTTLAGRQSRVLGLGFNIQFPSSPGRSCVRQLCMTLRWLLQRHVAGQWSPGFTSVRWSLPPERSEPASQPASSQRFSPDRSYTSQSPLGRPIHGATTRHPGCQATSVPMCSVLCALSRGLHPPVLKPGWRSRHR